jgi:DNA polymerase-4
MARCIFHIDLDAFFVSVEQALNPELKGKPVIVGGDPERRGVVSSASYEAPKFNIHAAMPLSQAHRLCPQATFIQTNFSRYRDASARFMEILASFSPAFEPLGIDEAYLDVTGYEQPYGSPRKLALAIKKRIYEELKVTASVGIATCKVIAKIASDSCKPDGLLEIAPGKGSRTFLTLFL